MEAWRISTVSRRLPRADFGPAARKAGQFPSGAVNRRSNLSARLRVVSYCSRILCMPRGNPSPSLPSLLTPAFTKTSLRRPPDDGVSVSAWMDRCGAPSAAPAGRFGGGRAVGKSSTDASRQKR